MRRFYTLAGIRNISDKEIRVIRRKANSGDPEAAMFMELMFDCGIPDPTTQEWLNWLSGDSNS